MRRWLSFFLGAGFVLNAAAQSEDMPGNQKAEKADVKFMKQVTMHYLLFTPQDYDKDKKTKWPLMIFLHGAGERGTNLAKVAVHGPAKIVTNRADFPFVVISPQCPNGAVWEKEAIIALLDRALREYRVDPERVYLTGLSMGGFGTWSLAAAYPERFAAVAPICGGGNTIDVLLPQKGKEAGLKTLPVWAFYGGEKEKGVKEGRERRGGGVKRGG